MSTKKLPEMLTKHRKSMTLGRLLASIRQCEEMTQGDFASLLGVSKQYLCDIEHERRFISPKVAEAFAKKTGYSSAQFVRLCLQGMLRRDGIRYEVELVA